MKIIDELTIRCSTYGDMEIGDAFLDKVGAELDNFDVFMKIKDASTDACYANAVSLGTGNLVWFDYDTKVVPVSSELKVSR